MPSLEELSNLPLDQLLQYAKKAGESDALLKKVLGGDTRKEALKLIKKANPTMVIPEIDAASDLETQLEAEREERRKLEAEYREDKLRRSIEAEHNRVKSEHGLSDKDFEEVHALMLDEKDPIPSYGAAVKVWKASKQLATPTPASFENPTFTMPDKDVWAKGIGNPGQLNKIFMSEMYNALNEIRSGKVAQ